MLILSLSLPQQFEELLKHKQLELQLGEAKLAQQMVAMAETKESNLVERQYVRIRHSLYTDQ